MSDERNHNRDSQHHHSDSKDDLLAKFFNEELSVQEQAALAGILGSSESERERFAFYMQTESELLQLASQRKMAAEQCSDKSDMKVRNLGISGQAELRERAELTPHVKRRRLLAVGSCSLAVTVLLAIGLLTRDASKANASELFKKLELASQKQFDRVYSMERLVRNGDKTRRYTGELSCRGTKAFVAVFPEAVLGGQGKGFWCVPAFRPSFSVSGVSEIKDEYAKLELGWLDTLLSDSEEGLALSAAKVLSLIRIHGYEIVREPVGTTNDDFSHDVLTCRLMNNQTKLPRTVRVRADRDSQEIVRLELDWGAGERGAVGDLLVFELKSVGPLPPERFKMETYLQPATK